jgi:hypothetical protein
MGWDNRTWTAVCNGKVFHCSQIRANVSCAPGEEKSRSAEENPGSKPSAENPGGKPSVPRCCFDHSLPCGACPPSGQAP